MRFADLFGSSLVALLLWGASPAFATHEIDHRYTIYGNIWDEKGRPVPDARVVARDTVVDESSMAFTEGDGYYEILLHLHDQNLGDEVVVTSMDKQQRVKVTFDKNDKFTERRHRVDFGQPAAQGSVQPLWTYGLGALLIVGLVASWGLLRKRLKRRSGKQKARV